MSTNNHLPINTMENMENTKTPPSESISYQIWDMKYRYKDKDGNPIDVTVEDTWKRVANNLASVEKNQSEWYEKFYEALYDWKFIPAGRILSNAGTSRKKTTYLNCYVIPVEDSMEGIFDAVKWSALTQKQGGGVGFDFSKLRPKGFYVQGVDSVSSGPISFMRVFDSTCKTIMSAGCLTGDSMVSTTKGLIPIKEIVESKEEFFVRTHLGNKKVISKFNNGIGDIYKITLINGYTIKCTKDHKFFFFDKYGNLSKKPISEFAEGDCVLYYNKQKYKYDEHKSDGDDFFYFAGVYFGSGHDIKTPHKGVNDLKGEGKKISFCNDTARNKLLQRVNFILRKIGLKIGTSELNVGLGNCKALGNYYVQFLQKWKEACELTMPKVIFTESLQNKCKFIAGLIDSDGCCCYSKKYIKFTTTSYDFAKSFQLLLSELGILSSLSEEKSKNEKLPNKYNITVNGKRWSERLIQCVSPYISKKPLWIEKLRNNFYGFLKEFVCLFIRNKIKVISRLWGNNKRIRTMSSNTFAKIAEENNYYLDYSFVPIKSIEYIGKDNIYDIEVEDAHGYCANGIYVSNSRRGAMIGLLRVDHPDIEEFINAKKDNVSFKMFNLSVAITDKFMEAVKLNGKWDLVYDNKIVKTVDAVELWDKIMKSTYDYAEPGVLFIDRINQLNNLYYCEYIDSVNPCGEQPLPSESFGACLLGSVNLSRFVINEFESNAKIDFDAIRKTVSVGVRMLDNVIDITGYPLKQQEQGQKNKRRIGIGITGFADMLAFLSIKYGSPESVELAERIMKEITETAYKTSAELAKEKGAFPLYKKEEFLNSKFVKQLSKPVQDIIRENGIRNSHLTSIAPTGTISLVAGNVSSGLEPIFELSYTRKYLINSEETREQVVYDYAVNKYREKMNIKDNEQCDFPDFFKSTAQNISVKQHIDIQAAFQKFVDAACSKTINVPPDYDYEEFKGAYLYAYNAGLKGCTTYRPNPNVKSVLSCPSSGVFVSTNAPKRPEVLPCHIYHFKSGGKEWVALIGILEGKPYEVFAGLAQEIKIPTNAKESYIVKRKLVHRAKYDLYINKGCDNEIIVKDIVSQFDNNLYGSQTRLISMCLRHGAAVKYVVEQLEKDENPDLHSFHKGIMRVLKKYIPNGAVTNGVCDNCGSNQLVYESGCKTCKNCGHSKCS